MARDWFNLDNFDPPILQFGDDLEQKILRPLSCIVERETKWILEFDLPLVEKKDINIYTDEGVIVVEAKLREVYRDSKFTRHQYEHFKKTVSIPTNADTKKISARFTNGRLIITIPKTFQGTKIKIED
ncbi:MAG TPA: Hsp20/alpha crystallin family protein [Candidatus Nitrosotenuis sp.]|nr:Hsp20/alpha crystallin family protein [Candidatus Nitrosotenuis sp.]